MDFSLSEEQELLLASIRELITPVFPRRILKDVMRLELSRTNSLMH